MSGDLDFKAGRFRVIKDGRVAFDTQTPAARLAPSKALLLNNYEIEWPDLWKGIVVTLVNSRNDVTGTYVGRGSSYIGLLGQEWGPDKTYVLPDIILGPAPAGANYLNIKVNLVNTVVPGKVLGDVPIRTSVPSGKWTRLSGSSCRVESYSCVRRTFDILISGGNIILRRYQSVLSTTGNVERRSVSVSTSNGTYFYYRPGSPGTNAGYSNGEFASLGQWLSNASSSSNPNNVINGLEMNTALVSYRSVWKGSLEIIPGRVG